MAVNYFAGKSQTWLETELAKAQADLAAGKTIITASAGDVASGKMIQVDVRERIEKLLYALYLLDSTTYPATNLRVSRTRVAMYQS